MSRFIARRTIAFAAAGLLTLPAAALAQSTGSSQPPSQPPASQSTAAPAGDQSVTPADHVRQAKQALESIPKSSIPSADRAKFAQLRTHLNKLQSDVASASAKPSAKAAGWATDMAAIDKLITELAGPESSSPSAPSAPGTTGTTGTAPKPAASQLDEQARTALDQVRHHMAALASQMSGTASSASGAQSQATGSSTASNPDTMGTPPSSASQTASSSSASQSSNPSQPTQSPATGSQTTTPPAQTGTQSSVTQSPASSSQPPASAAAPTGDQAGQVDQAAAKQHLSEARDSLSALTTMPEAAKLQGEARSGVSQLISDFNELITTQLNWRDSDQKVEADLNKLLGPDNGEASPAPATPAGTMGTSGSAATGTTGATPPAGAAAGQQPSAAAGSVQLDPAIRAKLVEFRSHLKQFEQAAGGSGANAAMNPPVSTGSTTNPANPAARSAASSSASGTAGATGTTGTTPPAPAGTTGSAAPSSATAGGSATSTSLANRTEIERHLEAIQNLLNQAKDGKLDKAQTDQLKTEVEQLRQLLGQSN